jgi:hypothetical protein
VAGGGEAYLLGVDRFLECWRVVGDLQAVEDPLHRAMQACGQLVDAPGREEQQGPELGGLFDGREVAAGYVFREAYERCGLVVGLDDVRGDGDVAQGAERFEAMATREEFVPGERAAQRDGVQEADGGDVRRELLDALAVEEEASVVGVSSGDRGDWDQGTAWGCWGRGRRA